MSACERVYIYDGGPDDVDLKALGRAFGAQVFHAGVEVHGTEYSFCPPSEGAHGSGVCKVPYRRTLDHEPIDMGKTRMSWEEVNAVYTQLNQEWAGRSNIFRNCCHFADELCKRLRGRSW